MSRGNTKSNFSVSVLISYSYSWPLMETLLQNAYSLVPNSLLSITPSLSHNRQVRFSIPPNHKPTTRNLKMALAAKTPGVVSCVFFFLLFKNKFFSKFRRIETDINNWSVNYLFQVLSNRDS